MWFLKTFENHPYLFKVYIPKKKEREEKKEKKKIKKEFFVYIMALLGEFSDSTHRGGWV